MTLSPNTTYTTINPRITRHDTSLQLAKWSHIYPKNIRKRIEIWKWKRKAENSSFITIITWFALKGKCKPIYRQNIKKNTGLKPQNALKSKMTMFLFNCLKNNILGTNIFCVFHSASLWALEIRNYFRTSSLGKQIY